MIGFFDTHTPFIVYCFYKITLFLSCLCFIDCLIHVFLQFFYSELKNSFHRFGQHNLLCVEKKVNGTVTKHFIKGRIRVIVKNVGTI